MAFQPYEPTRPLNHRADSSYDRPPTAPAPQPPLVQSYESGSYMDEKMPSLPNAPPLPPRPFEEAGVISIPVDMFDRMFSRAYNQETKPVQHKYANPTPLAIVGFLISCSPLSCDLMGWRGAGEHGAASVGAYFFIGGILMLLGGLLQWVAGNTFPFVVFASFGGFWLSYGATLTPSFNAYGAYSPDTSSIKAGLDTKGFNASFGFFMIFMAVLCLVYLLCALRTNLVFVVIFAGLMGGFVLLTATFWLLADGGSGADGTLYVAGASLLVACMAGWYLLLSLLLESVDFPIALPLVDISGWIPSASARRGE